jgi:hypothetical protein
VSQYFVRLPWPVGPVFDLHLGYHVRAAQDVDVPNGGNGSDKLKMSGHTLTAGVRLGFQGSACGGHKGLPRDARQALAPSCGRGRTRRRSARRCKCRLATPR